MKIINIFIASSLLLSTSCALFKKNTQDKSSTETTTSSVTQKECPEDLICTLDYRAVAITVEASKQQMNIDDARLQFPDASQNKIKVLKVEKQDNQKYIIVLAEDGDKQHFTMNGTKVLLQLRSNGQLVVEKPYVIAHDCCHIKLISGEETIKL